MLRPHTATDRSRKHNSQHAVYATDRKDIAIGMALTGTRSRSFGDYEEKPFRVVFVEGKPARKAYVYVVSSASFKETPRGSHQWASTRPVRIIRKEIYDGPQLKSYWRRASAKEKAWFRTSSS
jgi:hypothetical protein